MCADTHTLTGQDISLTTFSWHKYVKLEKLQPAQEVQIRM